jgi:hypothetical protein
MTFVIAKKEQLTASKQLIIDAAGASAHYSIFGHRIEQVCTIT